MITVSVMHIFLIYLCATIIGMIILSYLGRERVKAVLIDKVVVDCPVCAFRYIVFRTEKIHRCPQCESLNSSESKM